MTGFFDLPPEIRDMIWTLSTSSLKPEKRRSCPSLGWLTTHSPSLNRTQDATHPILSISYPSLSGPGQNSNPAAWAWLATTSRVSKAFAAEGRPYFFRTHAFQINEECTRKAPAFDHFAGLERFLRWAGADARFIRTVEVQYDFERDRCEKLMQFEIDRLNDMPVGQLELQDLALLVTWAWQPSRMLSRSAPGPRLECELGQDGKFEAVAWDLTYSTPCYMGNWELGKFVRGRKSEEGGL